MKNVILAALAGFSVAFVAGVVSAPDASAESYIARCRSSRDCTAFGQTYCGGDQGICIYTPNDITYGHCECA